MKTHRDSRRLSAFTLIELLLVIGLIAILAAILIVAINPTKQLRSANDSAAFQDLNTIHKGMQQHMIDFEVVPQQVGGPAVVDTDREICREDVDRFQCAFQGYAVITELVPNYLVDIPVDPKFASELGTGFQIHIDENNRYHVSSPNRGLSLPQP